MLKKKAKEFCLDGYMIIYIYIYNIKYILLCNCAIVHIYIPFQKGATHDTQTHRHEKYFEIINNK